MTNESRPGRILPVLAQDEPIDRRAFLRGTLEASALAMLVAACGGGGESSTGPTPQPPPGTPPNLDVTVTLASQPVLAQVNGVAQVGSGTRGFFLIRTGTDTFRALSFVCPHQATNNRWTVSGTGAAQRFTCGNHGAEFDLEGTPRNTVTRNGMRRFTTEYNAAAGTVRVTGFV